MTRKNTSPLRCRLFGHKHPGHAYIGRLHIAPGSGPGSRCNVTARCGRDGCTHSVDLCVVNLPTEHQMEDGHNIPGADKRADMRRRGLDPWAPDNTPVHDADLNYTGWP